MKARSKIYGDNFARHFGRSLIKTFFFGIFCLHNLSGQPILQANALNPNPKVVALLVGISDYQHLKDLRYADRDARIFEEFLQGQKHGHPLEVYTFTDSLATRMRVYDVLDNLMKDNHLVSGDRLICYFSCHGDVYPENQDAFLLMNDCPVDNFYNGGVDLGHLDKFLQSFAKRGVECVVFLDACRSGKLTEYRSVSGSISDRYVNFNDDYDNTVLFLSCKPNEFSQESADWGGGRGLFSFFTVEGLSGAANDDQKEDGYIYVWELERFLEDMIPIEAFPRHQTPFVRTMNKNIRLAVVEHQGMEIKAIISKDTVPLIKSNLDSILLQQIQKAIDEKRLIVPERNNAYFYFQQMQQTHGDHRELPQLKRKLYIALLDQSQKLLNWLLGNDVITVDSSILSTNIEQTIIGLELLPKDHPLYREWKSHLLLFQAVEAMQKAKEEKKHLDQVNELLNRAIKEIPKAIFAWALKGFVNTELNNWDQAELALDTALAFNPNFAKAYYFRARLSTYLYEQEGKRENLEIARKAIKNYLTLQPYTLRIKNLQNKILEYLKINGKQQPLVEDHLFVKGILKKKSSVSDAPNKETSSQLLHAFDIIYIYDDSDPVYYQIGMNDDGPTGYVLKKDVQWWNSRICMDFASTVGREPALVFEDVGLLTECVRGSQSFYDTNGKPHPNSIAIEPDRDLSGKRFPRILPILDRQQPRVGARQNTLFKIGFLSDGEANYIPIEESSKTISEKASELELMFLIDATGSMQPYINNIKKIVEQVTKRIIQSRESVCRFGVMAYQDYDNELAYKQVSNLTRNSRNAINALSAFSSEGEYDTPEAVYDGFLGALTETKWREAPNTPRIIVMIGDASAYQPEDERNPKNLSPEQLIRKASEIKVWTLAVKINPSLGDRTSASQFNYLAEGLTSADKGQYLEIVYEDILSYDFIDKTSAKIEAEIIRLEELIKSVDGNKNRGKSAFSSIRSATEQVSNFDNKKFEPGRPWGNEFSTGWINQFTADGVKVVDTYAYMTKDEFDLMLNYIEFSQRILSDPDRILAVIMKKTIEVTTGEELKGTDIEAHYEKSLGLPIKTDLLKIPIGELSSWGADRKARMLELIKEKIRRLENFGNDPNNWHNSPGRNGMKYTFIPLDMLP